jgi:hypothetical protein
MAKLLNNSFFDVKVGIGLHLDLDLIEFRAQVNFKKEKEFKKIMSTETKKNSENSGGGILFLTNCCLITVISCGFLIAIVIAGIKILGGG